MQFLTSWTVEPPPLTQGVEVGDSCELGILVYQPWSSDRQRFPIFSKLSRQFLPFLICTQLCIQHSESFSSDIDCTVDITIMVCAAFGTIPFPDGQILRDRTDTTATGTHLGRRKEAINELNSSTISLCLVSDHRYKFTPWRITDRSCNEVLPGRI